MNRAQLEAKNIVMMSESDKLFHSGINVNHASDGSVEISAWWPDPSKDDSSPGYKPHISEVRVAAGSEGEGWVKFEAECYRLGLVSHD